MVGIEPDQGFRFFDSQARKGTRPQSCWGEG